MKPESEALFNQYIEEVRAKCSLGEAEHGDKSLEMTPGQILHELKQEALDSCGWGWLQWLSLRRQEALWRLYEEKVKEHGDDHR